MSSSPVTVITTSYNQRATLELLLESLRFQTVLDFEVLVADDGSSDGTLEFLDQIKTQPNLFPFGVRYVTQPDDGYQKAKILNEAIRQTAAPYLIFLDSDVLVERHFVEDHLTLRRPGGFVCGRRVDLGARVSKALKKETLSKGVLNHPQIEWVLDSFFGYTVGLKRGFRLPWGWVRRGLGYEGPLDILGSNMSLWRDDLIEVNGFNEALRTYWGEDGDLYIRLRNSKKKPIGAKGLCIQYHLFHPRREPDPQSVERYRKMLEDRSYVWCDEGLVLVASPKSL